MTSEVVDGSGTETINGVDRTHVREKPKEVGETTSPPIRSTSCLSTSVSGLFTKCLSGPKSKSETVITNTLDPVGSESKG